jgi:hypothetical protein
MVYASIVGRWQQWRWFLIPLGLVVAGVSLFLFSPPLARYTQDLTRILSPPQEAPVVVPPLPRYTQALTLGQGMEWRFAPLVIDVNGDGAPDLVATARLADPALSIWWGDGHTFTPATPTWTNIGYAALTTGDINHDGCPDLVGASHFGKVQTLLSDGKGGFTETIMQREDGYVATQLANVNGDGELDLILLGFQKLGIEIYLGDGHGHWTLHTRLPNPPAGRTMPGRDLVVGDLNHDGHVDIHRRRVQPVGALHLLWRWARRLYRQPGGLHPAPGVWLDSCLARPRGRESRRPSGSGHPGHGMGPG